MVGRGSWVLRREIQQEEWGKAWWGLCQLCSCDGQRRPRWQGLVWEGAWGRSPVALWRTHVPGRGSNWLEDPVVGNVKKAVGDMEWGLWDRRCWRSEISQTDIYYWSCSCLGQASANEVFLCSLWAGNGFYIFKWLERKIKRRTFCDTLKTIWNSDSGVHKSGCIYSCTYCLWLLAFAYRGRAKSLWQRMYGPGSSKYCLSVPIQKHSPSGGLGSMGEWLYPSCGVSSPSSRLEVTLVVV